MPAIAETVTERQVIKESKTYNNLTADGIVSSIVNNGGVFYMEDAQDTTLTFKGNTVFSNNSLTNLGMGGAIGNGWLSTKNPDKWPSFTPGGKIVFDGKASFSNNTAKDSNGGGALFNFGVGTVENPDIVFNGTADFTGNKALGESSSVYVGGGAVHHHGGAIVFNQDATFTNNTSATKGGAVMASGDVVFKGDAKFAGNTAKTNGGGLAIIGGDVVFEKNASFTGNTAGSGAAIAMTEAGGSVLFKKAAVFENNKGTATLWSVADSASIVFEQGAKFSNNTNVQNGTLQNAGTLELKSGDFTFVRNTGTNGGGIKTSGTVNVNTTGSVLFDSNVTTASAGAIDTSGTTTFIAENVSFLNNSSDSGYAGAVFNTGDLYILGKENIFSGNIAKDTKVVKSGGGALHNRGSEGTASLIVGTNDSENVFKNNQSYAHGGAIVARAFDGEQENSDVVINGDTEFVGNSATLNGGAIWNSAVESDGSIGIAKFAINGDVEFKRNTAGDLGGAIYNGGTGATVDLSDAVAVFNANNANRGGAIYNAGTVVLSGGEFEDNIALYEGGAIHNRGTLIVEKTEFEDNIAKGNYGGAIYNSASGMIAKIDAYFKENENVNDGFTEGGAIANIGKIGELIGIFDSNRAHTISDKSAKGGAIYTYATSNTDSVQADFKNNVAISGGDAMGGAIVNDGKIAKLHQINKGFVNNISYAQTNAWAGALYNSQNAEIGELIADFTGNSAKGVDWAIGGALVNFGTVHTLTGKFTNNYVSVSSSDGYALGGAIYNAGVLNFDGNVVFENNTANGGANDIYNEGVININSGTTMINGGITADGAGTLNVSSDATLDIGTAAIVQDAININGTVVASVVSDRSYGRFVTDNLNFADDAVLKLNIGAVGTYNILAGKVIDVENIIVGDTYNAISTSAGITVETKSVAEIAEKTGLDSGTAGSIVNLANATDRNVQKLSLKLQEVLNSGDVAAVEKETAKLNPEDKPVTRSVAMATQNQVLSVATNRMGGGFGRAGGDSVRSSGFWAQGLYNKSDFAGEFEGTSNGFAVGTDMTIDRKYTLGAGFAYNNTDIDANGRETAIDNTTLFVYGQYKPNNWFLNGIASYTMGEYDENVDPFGVTVNSVYDVNSYGAQIMTGYDFAFGITPMMGVRYLHVEQDAYNNGINSISAQESDYMSGVAGLKYAVDVAVNRGLKLRPELRAAATYDLVSDDAMATVTMANIENSYTVDAQALSQIGGEFGVGLTALYNGIQLSVNYDMVVHEDYTSQTGMIKFRGQF